jgi:hypothetical protein
MYNPSGDDSGREWIEFYNNGSSVNIEGWKLNEGNTNHGISVYQGSYLIEGGDFFVIAYNPEDFLLDYPDYNGKLFDSVFSLSNTGKYLSLKDCNLSLVDEFNYSNLAEEGYSLFNFDLSGNWGQSIVEGGTPGYYEISESDSYDESVVSEVEINNVPPKIIYLYIYPDEGFLEGIQIFPDINGKNITINVFISDNNSDDLNVNFDFEKEVELVNLEIINNSYFNYTWNIFMEPYDEPKVYNLVLNVDDGINYINKNISFEYKSLMYIDFSKSSLNFGNVNPGENSEIDNLSVFNKGNVDISLSVSGSDLNCGDGFIPISSIETFFDVVGYWKNLMNSFLSYNKTLPYGPNHKEILSFRLKAPVGVRASNYSGIITIMGG